MRYILKIGKEGSNRIFISEKEIVLNQNATARFKTNFSEFTVKGKDVKVIVEDPETQEDVNWDGIVLSCK